MATTIITKYGSGAPTASDVVRGELAVDTENKRLYTEDSGGSVVELGTNPAANVTFGDNVKAIFGAGSDLQIYHDGSHSYVSDQGTGQLRILASQFQVMNAAGTESMVFGAQDNTATLYYDNSAKLATTSTGIDVTGTVTADGLTVDGDVTVTGASAISLSSTQHITYQTTSTNATAGDHIFKSYNTEIMRIDGNNNRVGIGTTSPSELLHVSEGSSGAGRSSDADTLFLENNGNAGITIGSSTTGTGSVRFADSGGTGRGVLFYDHSSDFMSFHSAGGERMRITSAGKVGLNGNTNPTGELHIGSGSGASVSGSADDLVLDQSGNAGLTISTGASAVASIFFADPGSVSAGYVQYTHSDNALAFATQATEAMRIDSSGNLLVGTSTTIAGNEGMVYFNGSSLRVTRDSDEPLNLDRLSTDGSIIDFKKDGTTVGSIGVATSVPYFINTQASGSGLRMGTGVIQPSDNAGAKSDDAHDLGSSSGRFQDIYATNGTIQTSDRNEKQDIEALSDAEQRVAVAAKGLLRKFRWISSVEENGDEARIHFGIIAQDLQAAFEAEGLDAGRYAMFINSTWTDEETGEERSRMGVRYSELLAFIIAAI